MSTQSVDPFTGQPVPPVRVISPPAAAPAPIQPQKRRSKSWLQLPPQPPGADGAEYLALTEECLRNTVEKILARKKKNDRRQYFAASADMYLGINAVATLADLRRPHLILAANKYELYGGVKVHLAAMLCNAEHAEYYANPVAEEAARFAFRKLAQHAPYKAVIEGGRCWDSQQKEWGKDIESHVFGYRYWL